MIRSGALAVFWLDGSSSWFPCRCPDNFAKLGRLSHGDSVVVIENYPRDGNLRCSGYALCLTRLGYVFVNTSNLRTDDNA